MSKAKSTADAVSEAIRRARAALDQCNAEVGRLYEERQAIAGAPCTRDEAKAAAEERINAAAADGRRRLGNEAAKFAQGDGSGFDPKQLLVHWVWAQESYRPDTDVLLALCARELVQVMHAAIDADPRFDDGNAIPNVERENRLAKIDAEITEAEGRREQLERELSAAGFFPEAEPATPKGGDRGMEAFHEEHERRRQGKNAELERAGVTERTGPKRIAAFEPVRRVSVGEEG